MKIEDLKKLIKPIIQEEIKKAVSDEVNRTMGRMMIELIKESKSPSLKNNQQIDDRNNNEFIDESTILKTKNPKINSILMETTKNLRKNNTISGDIRTNFSDLIMGGDDFEKIGNNDSNIPFITENRNNKEFNPEPNTNMSFLKQMVSEDSLAASNSPTQTSILSKPEIIPDSLKDIFKKDYRKLFKKMDDQKSGKAPTGFINPAHLS